MTVECIVESRGCLPACLSGKALSAPPTLARLTDRGSLEGCRLQPTLRWLLICSQPDQLPEHASRRCFLRALEREQESRLQLPPRPALLRLIQQCPLTRNSLHWA